MPPRTRMVSCPPCNGSGSERHGDRFRRCTLCDGHGKTTRAKAQAWKQEHQARPGWQAARFAE